MIDVASTTSRRNSCAHSISSVSFAALQGEIYNLFKATSDQLISTRSVPVLNSLRSLRRANRVM